ncbi:MAG: hydroxyisourate hydrolase [Pseudomonadota bacterium]
MAQFTTHLLSSVDGRHAAGVPIRIVQRTPGRADIELVAGTSDTGGRFSAEITPQAPTPDTRYEFAVATAHYFADVTGARPVVVDEITVRFALPDPTARYHMPLMIAPNSHSLWWSPPGG